MNSKRIRILPADLQPGDRISRGDVITEVVSVTAAGVKVRGMDGDRGWTTTWPNRHMLVWR